MANLMQASNEWMKRPDDERFASLDALLAAVRANEAASHTLPPVRSDAVRAVANGAGGGGGSRVQLVLGDDSSAAGGDAAVNVVNMNHWSFGQASQLVKAPARYLRSLPADLAAAALTHGFRNHRSEARDVVPFVDTRTNKLRALTGTAYARVSDVTLVRSLHRLEDRGWILPPDWSGQPSGAFYGDRNLFVTMIDSPDRSLVNQTTKDRRDAFETLRNPHTGRDEKLGRFIMIGNSSVGNMSFWACLGYMRFICGNLIIWGAERVTEFRLRHVGDSMHMRIAAGFNAVMNEVDNVDDDLLGIRESMVERIDADSPIALASGESVLKKELAPMIVKRSAGAVTRPLAERIIGQAVNDDEDPRTAWGAVQGLTALARDQRHRDATIDMGRLTASLMAKPTRSGAIRDGGNRVALAGELGN